MRIIIHYRVVSHDRQPPQVQSIKFNINMNNIFRKKFYFVKMLTINGNKQQKENSLLSVIAIGYVIVRFKITLLQTDDD